MVNLLFLQNTKVLKKCLSNQNTSHVISRCCNNLLIFKVELSKRSTCNFNKTTKCWKKKTNKTIK